MAKTRKPPVRRTSRKIQNTPKKDERPSSSDGRAGVEPKKRAPAARRKAQPQFDVNAVARDATVYRAPIRVKPDPFLSATRSLSAASLSLSAACLSMSSACLSLSGPFESPAPRPFAPRPFAPPKQQQQAPQPKAKPPRVSPHFPHPFPAPDNKQHPHFVSTLPFPPLSHDSFGLVQERLAHDPFRLLLATIFLNKTQAERAMPVFHQLMEAYPSAAALARATVDEVTTVIRTLGFQNQRAKKCIEFAQAWVAQPPARGKRYRKLHYPQKGHGKDVKAGQVLDDHDPRAAWEISHLPGLGPYSHDSWRMFCRDELRGLASDWLGSSAQPMHDAAGRQFKFEPEWKRVLPEDKELRAWMTWMWLKEGLLWNKDTGEKTKASADLIKMARGGGVVQDRLEDASLTIKGKREQSAMDKAIVERPAGDFMPR